jgi:hypothetical protein
MSYELRKSTGGAASYKTVWEGFVTPIVSNLWEGFVTPIVSNLWEGFVTPIFWRSSLLRLVALKRTKDFPSPYLAPGARNCCQSWRMVSWS